MKNIMEVLNELPLVGQNSVWEECIKQSNTPCHIFITGSPGCGKTTLMEHFMRKYSKEKGFKDWFNWGSESTDDCLLLSPDQDRGIQTIRGQVSMFIRQKGTFTDCHRWVIIDDVDTFPQISQQALRRPMESYAHITRFLFIGTNQEDLIPALRSRCIHIQMNVVNPFIYKANFLSLVQMPTLDKFTDDMWTWVINIAGNNISDLVRLLKLISDSTRILDRSLTINRVQSLCSAPFYMDFLPLLTALSNRDIVSGTSALLAIWKRGYAYEDILESFQIINNMFGTCQLFDNIIVHKFLILAWIAYCKGNTSILSLQNVLYNIIMNPSIPDRQLSTLPINLEKSLVNV